nr:vitamin B12 dependent-methionine synthase activation domain-containing protein [uncultured Sellimonas sp.]
MDKMVTEAIRYLGYGNHAIDEQTLVLIRESLRELGNRTRPRFVYRIFELSQKEENCLEIEQWNIKSKSLFKNLKGCEKVIVFAATLGIEADLLIRKYGITEMAKAVVLQACSAAFLEAYCDRFQDEIESRMKKEGYYIRPRFSPGYGDFDICHQENLLQLLQADKRIGLSMTDGYMLIPSKSVTALMGASTIQTPCHKQGCEVCEKKDCIYKRNGN